MTYRSMTQAAGIAAIRTPTSMSEIIHELSSAVIGMGVVSSSVSFGIAGDAQPLAVPLAKSKRVAIYEEKPKGFQITSCSFQMI